MAEQTLTQIVEKIFRNQGNLKRLKGELAVYYWPRIAGSQLAAKVAAVRYRDGNLYLETDNPALAHQVSFMNYEIIQRFHRLLGYGVVKSIKVKIAPIAIPIVAATEKTQVELTEQEQSLINECCKAIGDTKIVAPFRNLMCQDLTRKQRLMADHGNKCRSCNTPIAAEFIFCPCCERQIRQEVHDYLQYLQRTNHESATTLDLQIVSHVKLAELHANLIRQIQEKIHPFDLNGIEAACGKESDEME